MDPSSSLALSPRASSIHPQNPLQVRAGGVGNSFSEGLYEEWVGCVCSFCSFHQLPGKSECPPPCLPAVLYPLPPHSLSPHLPVVICACFPQGLTMNLMKTLGRKASLTRYLAACPHPTFGVGTLERVPVLGSARVGTGLPEEAGPQAARMRLSVQCAPVSAHLCVCPTVSQAAGPPHTWVPGGSGLGHSTWGPHRARETNPDSMCMEYLEKELATNRVAGPGLMPSCLSSRARNGSTSIRGRRPWQWWTRSWPRRRTGSLRRTM